MIHPLSKRIRPGWLDMLWHYASGAMPCYLDADQSQVGWVKYSHRGIQVLDKVEFPKAQRRYIFSPKFTIKYNQAFEQCLRNCATGRKDGRTWITPEVFEGYMNLHRRGYAHSFEAWQDGVLVGGAIGVQIGGFITCETMFHHVSNASKAVWGQTLVRLRERGFKWIDTNCVASHKVAYGEDWVPQWRFEQMAAEAMRQNATLGDDWPCPKLPWQLRLGLPASRLAEKAARKLGWRGFVIERQEPERSAEPLAPEPRVRAEQAVMG
jgi:leucyl/phenylalanyl-tRNA--protein transferase